ncbi:hypothetical protein ACVNP1_16805 [Staphylococcus aureus]
MTLKKSKLDNYYTLEISPNIRNSEEKQILETNIYNLIKKRTTWWIAFKE